MVRHSEAPPGWGRASQDQTTGDAGSDSAVGVVECTTPPADGSRLKEALVEALCWIFELSPPLAQALGRLVLACWPGFRGA